jgi:hypothetical protein
MSPNTPPPSAPSKPTGTAGRLGAPHASNAPWVVPPANFAEVIGLWRCATELARVLEVEAVTVRAWRKRGIPARYWSAVAQAARVTGRPVDERLLAELASIRRGRNHG